MKIKHSEPYAPLRRKAYPSTGDQLGVMIKVFESLQTQGITLPQEAIDLIAQCKTVKDKYKKPK